MDSRYYVAEAIQAQREYCETHNLPHFAPFDGRCYSCQGNIYAASDGHSGACGGYSVEYAASHLITSCPHCRRSFVD